MGQFLRPPDDNARTRTTCAKASGGIVLRDS